MEPSRIERALRSRPSDEPVYRAAPLVLDTPTGARGGLRGMTRSMAVGVAALAIVALVGAMAFGVLSPVFGPAGDPLPALCSPDRLDFRVVRVTDVTGTRRIETELENLGEEGCAVPRAMHVRILDRPNSRGRADSEFTALKEGREHLEPGIVRLPSGSVARGIIEWTNLCSSVDEADLSVQAFLSERPGSPGTRVETAYDPDGRAGVPACLRPESIALVSPLTITDASEAGEWGPLAVTTGPGNGDLALTTGVLRISDACVVLETMEDRPTLLVWSSRQATWDAQSHGIVFHTRDGQVVEIRDGQQVRLGGSDRGFSPEVVSDGEWDGRSWDEWITTIDWAAAPDPTCHADFVWSVGDVSPVPTSSIADPAAPSASTSGHESLLRGLREAGLDAHVGSRFGAGPFPGSGVALCVSGESLQVYEFRTEAQAQAAVTSIDPDDPSHVGDSIVEWVGNPKFWQGDRSIVLYAGSDPDTEDALDALLGEPFAAGGGRGGFPEERDC